MRSRHVLASVLALILSYGAARTVDAAFTFSFSTKTVLRPRARPVAPALRRPLALRLVDAGGTGILADSARWGHDYSHATRAFQHLMLPTPPYIDTAAFAAVRRDWNRYLARIVDYGNNGVVLPGVLNYVNFDYLRDGAVYGPDDPMRARHVAWRRQFAALFDDARRRGVDVYLATDLLTLTPPLARYLERRGGINPERPALWTTYAAGFAELLDSLPQIRGVVIRIGEGGALYTAPGWPYRSEFAVKTVSALRAMLGALLPVFEQRGRTLILRTWSVGGGELGDMHTNPAKYAAALGDIDSPSLVVSTKYTSGDFHGYLPVNATLRSGRQHRLIEFQARREYEGFAAFPNYVAPLHQAALADVLAANPRIIGSWLWTQEGGPLRAGPMSLYPLHGSWTWIDANVYATSRLAIDPAADSDSLADDWARRMFPDRDAARAVAWVLRSSREAVELGLYVRPFAERRLRALGLDVPPLLWIHEWDVVGGSSAVWSTVYRGIAGHVDSAIADGFAAARLADAMRDTLRRVSAAHPGTIPPVLVRSLEYESDLLTTLAWYRRAMLEHYRWIDRGDRAARASSQESASRFFALSRQHEARFEDDRDAPAYDFSDARASLTMASRATALTWAARLLIAAVVLALAWPHPPRASLLIIAASGAVAILSAFASGRLIVSSAIVCTAGAVALGRAWRGLPPLDRRRGGRALGTAVLGSIAIVLAPAAVRGAGYFWFLMWGSAARVVLITAVLALTLVTLYRLAVATRPAVGGVLVAAGAAAVIASLIAPDLPTMLAALDRPLGLAPMGTSLLHGALAYLGLPRAVPWYPAIAGLLLVGAGWRLGDRSRRAARAG